MSKISLTREAAERAVLAEIDRTVCLLRESWMFTAGILVVLGFQLLDAKALLESPSLWATVSCYSSCAVLGLALLLAIMSQQSKGYAGYPRGNTLWDNLKPETVSEETAEEALVHMLLKTREQNARLNETRARVLSGCRWLFLIGVLLVAAGQLFDAYASSLTD